MHRIASNRTLPRLACVLLAAGLLGQGGCWGYREGGSRVSEDKHTYVSTTWYPKTLELQDTRTGEVLWGMDVPVGQKLAIQFYERQNESDPIMPSIMRWQIMPATQLGGTLDNSMPVPPATARLLKPTIRPAPEMPPSDSGQTHWSGASPD